MCFSDNAFVSNAYLEEITIQSNSELKEITLSTFSLLPYLKYLSLTNNSIDNIVIQTGSSRQLRTRYWLYLKYTISSETINLLKGIKTICCDLYMSYFTFSTSRKMELNHFPQLRHLDISGNNLDCNCTLQALLLSLSSIIKNFRDINITCKEKEITHTEKPYASSYYINFVGPSGRYNNEAEVNEYIIFKRINLDFLSWWYSCFIS